MILSPPMNDASRIDIQRPITNHPINEGLQAWYLSLPQFRGSQWYNLAKGHRSDVAHGRLNDMNPARDWSGDTMRPGSFGCLDLTQFDTLERYVDLNFTGLRSQSFTFSAWTQVGSPAGTLLLSTKSNNRGIIISIDPTNLFVDVFQGAVEGFYFLQGYFTKTYADNWIHVCYTYSDEEKRAIIYVNGEQKAVRENTYYTPEYTRCRIGEQRWATTDPYTSNVDDFRWWNRALSKNEQKFLHDDSVNYNAETLGRKRYPVIPTTTSTINIAAIAMHNRRMRCS